VTQNAKDNKERFVDKVIAIRIAFHFPDIGEKLFYRLNNKVIPLKAG